MGCDIHAVFQARTVRGNWRDIKSRFKEPRHYFLFAWLAGVRNGYGFAGIPTHDPITSIAEQRGLPSDFKVLADEHDGKWLGDHSHSWLSADEILAAPRPEGGRMATGIVSREVFERWDGKSEPDSYCGGISGPDIVVAASPLVMQPNTTHVRIEWPMPENTLDYFVDEIKRLRAEYGDVRIVFGFDS